MCARRAGRRIEARRRVDVDPTHVVDAFHAPRHVRIIGDGHNRGPGARERTLPARRQPAHLVIAVELVAAQLAEDDHIGIELGRRLHERTFVGLEHRVGGIGSGGERLDQSGHEVRAARVVRHDATRATERGREHGSGAGLAVRRRHEHDAAPGREVVSHRRGHPQHHASRDLHTVASTRRARQPARGEPERGCEPRATRWSRRHVSARAA